MCWIMASSFWKQSFLWVALIPFGVINGRNLTCPGFDQDTGVFKKTYHWPNTTKLPAEERSYECMVVELPQDNDYHMVAVDPYIDNTEAVGFVVLYGCTDNALKNHTVNAPYTCFKEATCDMVLSAWKVGTDPGHCMHNDTGFRVGNATGAYKYAKIEVLWLNPNKLSDKTDGSGVTLYLTANRRKYDAGVILIGQLEVSIPPGEPDYAATGKCQQMCTKKQMNGTIRIVSALNYMHYLGYKAVSQMNIPGTRAYYLAYDAHYSYDKPIMQSVNEIVMEPGYELQVTCHYNSLAKTERIRTGYSLDKDEECSAYITYYPKENVIEPTCLSKSEISVCEWEEPVVRGCNVTEFRYTATGKGKELYDLVIDSCAVDTCQKECKNVTMELYKTPCFSEPLRRVFIREKTNAEFWLKVGSCDVWHSQKQCPVVGTAAITRLNWTLIAIGSLITFQLNL